MRPNLFCNLNGKIILSENTPFQSADDSFRLRFGLYETYLLKNGAPEYADLHWERLLNGMEILGFELPSMYSESFFTQQIKDLAAQNNLSEPARIRLQVFSNDLKAPFTPQYLIECFELEASITDWNEEGIKVAVLKNFSKEKDPSNNCKISHNKHFIPARAAMKEHQLDDVLLMNEAGNIIESAIANLFWVKDGIVFTPPLSEGCLAGTIRAILMEKMIAHNIVFEEKPMTTMDLEIADEIFLCNGIRKIRWVRASEGRVYGNDFILKKLKKMFF